MHTTQEHRIGDAYDLLRQMPPESVDTVITSPPYHSLRDYGVNGQIGQEQSLDEYHERLLKVTAEIKRVMKPSAVLFWNHGDNYGGSGGSGGDYNEGGLREGQPKVGKSANTTPKCLIMQNERLILRMIDEQGWILRNRIIWHKSNGMPSSVQDRFANKYEPVYMLVKSKKYWFDLDAVRVPFKDPTEIKYRRTIRKNKEYNVKTPYTNNVPYQHNVARITSPESPNRVWADAESMERQIAQGKNPADVWKIESPEDDWKQLLEVASEIVGTDTAIAIFESYMQSRTVLGDVWRIPTQPYPESHFATFPTALIEPMIKAACPAEICPVCGLARERIADREFVPQQDVSAEKGVRGANAQKPMDESNQWQGFPRGTTEHHTVGWTSCDCNADWVAGTVLDPFCGSGTVLAVCRLLNRNAIGLELNPEYAPLIRKRSMSHTPPLTAYFGVEPGVVP